MADIIIFRARTADNTHNKTSKMTQYFGKCRVVLLIVLISLADIAGRSCLAQGSAEPKTGLMAGQPEKITVSKEPGLLFYLSGNEDFTADFARGGQDQPNFLRNVKVIPEGAKGQGFSCNDDQLMAYWAPGNIYAQRGTVSFFWRSRYPVGPTPFPIFRVGYADHSSWDMVWLRIDYNGAGFDAFVTDIGLARTRVSWYPDNFFKPDEWIHLSLSWDETVGIRFYVNGELVARQSVSGTVYDTGLDQFGPHSRIISPYQVQSAYCFMRGGDVDELRIYDRMLPDEFVADLAEGKTPDPLPPLVRYLSERNWRDAWWLRHGWNRPNEAPPALPAAETVIRKVEIHEAVDINRWYWKANDGIRETTWPGVYNMSRLPGRYDYFVLPDWDCYSGSGQSVRFTLPEEPWNHVEIWGKAWGQMTLENKILRDTTFGIRTQNQAKSWHQLHKVRQGGTIRFDNALIEEPIGSFDVYYIDKGKAPEGRTIESFMLTGNPSDYNNGAVADLVSFISGRYPPDECSIMLGVPENSRKKYKTRPLQGYYYPFIHILIPYSNHKDAGLDGIEISFPALNVVPTHNGVFPLNIRVKDPLWPMRDLADFSFSVKPGDSPVLWIDTRDRILPENRALYISIAGAGDDLTPILLQDTKIRLVYKSKEDSRPEHEKDRFTQVRDVYAHMVEEGTRSSRLNMFNRFTADCNDLLSVNPDHWLAKSYKYAATRQEKPSYEIAKAPEGIPEWAFLQVEYLRHLSRVIMYYIDKRQIANGEFGGGLSDDGDLVNLWPGTAFTGIEPDKLLSSLRLHMTAYYDNERPSYYASLRQRSLPLFTNGLATIFTDELHALEEGIQVTGALQVLDYGNPLYLERGMETALRMLEDITQINIKGHRHFRSRYYSGTKIATEDPWQWSVARSYNVLVTALLTCWYNGNPLLQEMIVEIADGLLEHARDGRMATEINFATDETRNPGPMGGERPVSVLYAAYRITGDNKYLEYLPGEDPQTRTFDENRLTQRYREEITNMGIREYINTEGSIWIDRISPYNTAIQEDRLGGVALRRLNILYPQHYVSWKFHAPANFESVAVFLDKTGTENLNIISYCLDTRPVTAEMTVWDIKPGRWKLRSGIDTDNDQIADSNIKEEFVDLGRGDQLQIVFSPRQYTIITLWLDEADDKGYWELPDLGIGPEDIRIEGNSITVRVHSLGAVAAPATSVELRDLSGNTLQRAQVPPLDPPLDLKRRWTEVILTVPQGTSLEHGVVILDPSRNIRQINRNNTIVKW